MNTTVSTPSSLPLEEQPVALLWGCELNSSNRKCVVNVEDNLLEQIVFLKSVSLGEGAEDELHVVAVESQNMTSFHKPVPIVSLQSSVLPTVSLGSFEFTPPVAFVLKSGTGPVYLVGQNLILEGDSDYESPGYDTQTDDTQAEDTQTDVDDQMDDSQTAEDTQMDGTQDNLDDTQVNVEDSGNSAGTEDYPDSSMDVEDDSRHR
ncbi:nucleoplasmin-like [Sphaerodactylus townsendi]|uniref:nucleoplasmin-like n=1 Tax=Sphaerodactylus townsendi TaxID=933632 RepID=UPI0020270A2B|nr:nucleoplasmin-like [Sphaerodactylus townsendi]